jgi:hypothetical protein
MKIPLLPTSSRQGRRICELPVPFFPLERGRIEERKIF